MPVTIKDIAKAAGVSHTTVSRALRGHSAISAETTARIRKLAQEMGYTPSAVAQSLLAQRTRTIGLVITTTADPFTVQVVGGVEYVAQTAGYSVFLSSSHNDPDREIAVVETFHRRRVDAIIVTSSRLGSLYKSRLDKIQVPIVLINNQEEGEYLYSVAVDDVQGAQLGVQHLIELGHRRIGYVGLTNRPKSNRRRRQGYETAMKNAGLPLDPSLIFSPIPDHDIFERGHETLEQILQRNVTAVFCYNDLTAIGLSLACRDRGIAVPERLSIVGFDDIDAAMYVTPPLTTVHQPRFELGQLAMEMVLDLLNGQEVQDKTVACHLEVRGSTAPPAH